MEKEYYRSVTLFLFLSGKTRKQIQLISDGVWGTGYHRENHGKNP